MKSNLANKQLHVCIGNTVHVGSLQPYMRAHAWTAQPLNHTTVLAVRSLVGAQELITFQQVGPHVVRVALGHGAVAAIAFGLLVVARIVTELNPDKALCTALSLVNWWISDSTRT